MSPLIPATEEIVITRPQPASRMPGRQARMVRKAPSRLVAIMLRQNSSDILWKARPSATPALAMQIWTGPRASTAAAILASTSASSRTSIARPNRPSPATSSSTSCRRPVIVTCTPCAANALAMARPMPVPPPVTSACFPASSMSEFSSLHVRRHPRVRRTARKLRRWGTTRHGLTDTCQVRNLPAVRFRGARKIATKPNSLTKHSCVVGSPQIGDCSNEPVVKDGYPRQVRGARR